MSTRYSCFLAALTWVAGCSTDSPQTAGDAGGGGSSGATAGTGGSSGTATGTGGGGSGGTPTGTGGGSSGASGSGGGSASLGDASNASPECVTFCSCMAKNCPDKVFADGCLPECAAGTSSTAAKKWDLPCRQNMCGLVPAQPNNDHCTHAFGTSQCD